MAVLLGLLQVLANATHIREASSIVPSKAIDDQCHKITYRRCGYLPRTSATNSDTNEPRCQLSLPVIGVLKGSPAGLPEAVPLVSE